MVEKPAVGRLADLLTARTGDRFVGRDAEVEQLRLALAADPPRFSVLWVYGPGGIGKSSLLQIFGDIAAGEGIRVLRLDGRDVQPAPQAVLEALAHDLAVDPAADVPEALVGLSRVLLMIDSYERLPALDTWFRTQLLPRLPVGGITVVAGRDAPSPEWRFGPGWQDLVRVIPLRNLEPNQSRAYLQRAGVPADLHERIVDVTHGHPLGLALVTDVVSRGGQPSVDPLAPDLVETLVRRFVDVVPSPVHRQALEVAALARVTTESLLREALKIDDAHDAFAWLRGLSFIESGAEGLCPHDLAREALDADLHWRDPEAYTRVFSGIREHIIGRLKSTTGRQQQRVLLDAKFMHRHQTVSRTWADWDSFGQHYPETARPEDVPAILELIGAWEGEESAAIAERWWDRQPAGYHVVRHHDGRVRGCIVEIDLTEASADDIAADPGAVAALDYARRQAPLRPGDKITQMRFSVDRETYQQPSPTLNLAPVLSIQHWLSTRRLALSLLVLAEPERWDEYFAFFEIPRAAGADFEVGGRRYGLFARDFRKIALDDWLLLMFERDLTGAHEPAPRSAEPVSLVLSQPEFETAVRHALRDLRRTTALADNPLVRSNLVLGRDDGREPAELLAVAIRGAVERLHTEPRDEKLFRVLDRTYLRGAATQERAAEVLDLPLSTYKRHLKRGVERIVADLWHEELLAG